jgi:hypothetical protein
MQIIKQLLLSVFVVGLLASCGRNKTTLEADDSKKESTPVYKTNIFSNPKGEVPKSDHASSHREVHVIEMLEGERYQYLRVRMADQSETWLVTRKGDFAAGGHYVFHQGLYKTNYHSTEFDRTFDEIYLVSDLGLAEDENGSNSSQNSVVQGGVEIEKPNEALKMPEGSVSIRDLITNSERYTNQQVQVTGRVVKVNPNIMDRNWVHLADGTMNSFDFVLTTTETIPAGHELTFIGTFRTDRDFGAGYTYDFILEEARLTR